MTSEVEEVLGRDVSRETSERLSEYVRLLKDEASRQNLIAKSTIPELWSRHIADSAQLVPLALPGTAWVDIGSGAGLPGMVVAILTGDPVTLIEPRRLRAEFLERVVRELGLKDVRVIGAKVETAKGQFDLISARAVASAPDLLRRSAHLAHKATRFLLMKGRSAQTELEEVRRAWHGDFRLVASKTDRDAAILIAENVRRKSGGRE